MQKREIVIVVLAGVALAYFGIDALIQAQPRPAVVSGEDVRECEDFVVQSRSLLTVLKTTPYVEYFLTSVGAEAWSNPFIRGGLITLDGAQSAISKKDPGQLLAYTGYIASGGQCWALINNQEYAVNDVDEFLGFRIIEITKEYAVLQSQDSETEEDFVKVMKEVENELF